MANDGNANGTAVASAAEPQRAIVTAPTAHVEAQTSQAEEMEKEGEPLLTPIVLDFLKSDRGHQLANRGLDIVEGVKKATLDEKIKSRALDGELSKLKMKQTWLLKTIGLFVVVGAIVGLSAANQLRGEASTILGAVAGYLFAQNAKER